MIEHWGNPGQPELMTYAHDLPIALTPQKV